jgi:hypothetical protein
MRLAKIIVFSCLTMLVTTAALGQSNPYTYVKMSLLVPWTLYFVFLAAVLIPFVVMMVLAWRRQDIDHKSDDGDGR